MAGANLIYGPGMLDSGNTFSYTQLLLDNETIRMIRRALKGIEISDLSLAVDLFKKVGPGGHFLAEQHTIDHMHREQARSDLFIRQVRDSWEKSGAEDAAGRARKKALEILQDYQPESLDRSVQTRLSEIAGAGEK